MVAFVVVDDDAADAGVVVEDALVVVLKQSCLHYSAMVNILVWPCADIFARMDGCMHPKGFRRFKNQLAQVRESKREGEATSYPPPHTHTRLW